MKARLEDPQRYRGNVAIKPLHQTTAVKFDPLQRQFTVSGERKQNSNELNWTAFSDSGYSHVVLAISPQCMRFIDLSTCMLDYAQRSALLMLQPGPSIKVGMKFSNSWWGEQGIKGGQSTTDRPVRTVVYPSHGDGKSKVLIASYCWSKFSFTRVFVTIADIL
jgi:monoamine oxidase